MGTGDLYKISYENGREYIMANMNETPSANRIHIGVFGRTNCGKSTLINKWTGQSVSITSDVKGTTTDPVYKAMEINPIGPCVIIDTPGFDDNTELGQLRVEKTKYVIDKADIAVVVISAELFLGQITRENVNGSSVCKLGDVLDFSSEKKYLELIKNHKTPVLIAINKIDIIKSDLLDMMCNIIRETIKYKIDGITDNDIVFLSAKEGKGIDEITEYLILRKDTLLNEYSILRELVHSGDSVMLVMPQDIQAPVGRLILPQVQTIRELLDKKCIVTSTTADEFTDALEMLKSPPKLIITDSQVFPYVFENKSKESLLTSFSILMAAQKGDIDYFVNSARVLDELNAKSRVLVAECCTHVPLNEDIGRIKIPNMLKKKYGESICVDFVSGSDFENRIRDIIDVESNKNYYDLIIHCGACMYNRKYVLSRISIAKEVGIPMTNYGVAIAKMSGILDNVVFP